MKALQDLRLFVRAARAASFSEAARALDLSPAAASAGIKRLEAELGVALFVRSTRQLRLSAEGEQFLQQCEQGLELLTQARENLGRHAGQVRGLIQLSLPSDLGRNQVLNWLLDFRRLHPQVELRLQITDRQAGLLREQVDVALRYGEPPDSRFISLAVAPRNRRVLCAAPSYLQRRGHPSSPAQLGQHDCLCFSIQDQLHNRWRFERMGELLQVDVGGPVACDDGDAVRRLALAGAGIAYKSRLDVLEDLNAGRLHALCTDWLGEPSPVYLICPERRALRPAVRRLREHLQRCCEQALASC